MENPSSPLDTLRQLKEMLDAGALTPSEFEALKQQLVFTSNPATSTPATPAAAPAAGPVAPSPPPPVQSPVAPPAPPVVPPPVAAPPPLVEDVPLNFKLSDTQPAPTPARPVEPENPPIAPRPTPLAPRPEPVPDADTKWVADEFPEAEAPAARSPLALILSIGGLLALLGLVVYLSLNKHPSEHISSTSRTAADSVATAIDTGPQSVPLAAPVATPETIRVRPTNPAPPVQRRPAAPTVRDSAVTVPPSATLADSSVTP